MKLSEELKQRGYIYQSSSENLEEIFDANPRTVYLGIDPTADAMHVGHLVPYMMLNHIMKSGHKVIVLMGGATALIGDPSFKEQERDIATVETIQQQCAGLEENVRKITTSDAVKFVNNFDWLSKLNAIEFLRDVGKHFTINTMIKKESVARRFEDESGISYTEFSYSLLQAYDFYHLFTKHGCDVQIGGSDQWGNIISGVDYVRRRTGSEVYGITMPLVVDKATGKKFGKSEGNAVWLDERKTSPFAFYQFWLNVSDESVIDYLKLFTFLSLADIEGLKKQCEANPGNRSAQKVLAREVTTFVHGEEVCKKVEKVSETLFGEVGINELKDEEVALLKDNAPLFKAKDNTTVVDVLVESKLASSKREARTFITSGAIQLNSVKVTNESLVISAQAHGSLSMLKRGKKNVALIEIV